MIKASYWVVLIHLYCMFILDRCGFIKIFEFQKYRNMHCQKNTNYHTLKFTYLCLCRSKKKTTMSCKSVDSMTDRHEDNNSTRHIVVRKNIQSAFT